MGNKFSTNNEAFEALKVYLVENYDAKVAAGGREIIKRCHICGDSRNASSRHMYIGLKGGMILYNCFKCQCSGVVDGKFFRDIGSYDTDMITLVNQNNKNNSNYADYASKKHFIKNMHPILTYRDAPETQKKVAYISKRLGHDFTLEELAGLKVILNLKDYLNANHINTISRSPMIIDQMDMFCLGFLSADSSYITLRLLVDLDKVSPGMKRYNVYNVYNNLDNSHKFYVIPTMINPLEKINIHIAEGQFDILGVYYNTDCDKHNSIFAAINGKSYAAMAKFFIREYGLINFDLHIYVDNDVDNYEMYKVADLLKPMGLNIYVHRNSFPGEKDYGVTRDHIIDSVVKL